MINHNTPLRRNPSDWIPYVVTESVFPLLVVIFLIWVDGISNISRTELLLATSMFSFQMVILARNRIGFWLSLLPAVLFCMAYGFEKGNPSLLGYKPVWGLIIIGILFACSFLERIWIPKRYEFPGE